MLLGIMIFFFFTALGFVQNNSFLEKIGGMIVNLQISKV